MKTIAVLCGSNTGISNEYLQIAEEFANVLSKSYGIVYGGTNVGLMGVFASVFLAQQGHIQGVITEKLKRKGVMHEGVSNIVVTSSMHERKSVIYNNVDLFLFFPGGLGTLDELFDLLSLKILGEVNKPIYIFNYNGFFDELLFFLEKISLLGFSDNNYKELFKVYDNLDGLKKSLSL